MLAGSPQGVYRPHYSVDAKFLIIVMHNVHVLYMWDDGGTARGIAVHVGKLIKLVCNYTRNLPFTRFFEGLAMVGSVCRRLQFCFAKIDQMSSKWHSRYITRNRERLIVHLRCSVLDCAMQTDF